MRITVFTPTFNRGYIIEKLYESLKNQTFKEFEWLVIDDGSNDNTEEIFDKINKNNDFFKVRYYKKENGGKHRAINQGVELAEGELFFIVDSDDQLTSYALEYIDKWEKSIENKKKFAGLAGNKGKNIDDIWGTTFNGKYIDCTSLERNKNNITGDKAEVFYTDILKKYKFMEFENENFITESTVWNKIAYDGYKIRWFNEVIYICDYLEDGLSNAGEEALTNNPKGTAYYVRQNIKYFNCGLKEKLSNYNGYYNTVKSKITIQLAARYLDINIITLVIAILLCNIKDKLRKSKDE